MPKKNNQNGPRFVQYAIPLINVLRDLGGSGRLAEVKNLIAQKINLSDSVLGETNESGVSKFGNDVEWARFYLAQAGYLVSSAKGVWALSDAGWKFDLSYDEVVKLFYEIHKGFVDKRKKTRKQTPEQELEQESTQQRPDEGIDYRAEMMKIILALSPSGFERLCQRLLREAGFENVIVTGRSGDGGLDGIGLLQVNPFVSFKILFQCKRYQGTVNPSQVRDFRGAMAGRADKGIILTTGTFTPAAQEEAVRDGASQVELVDGEKLLDMFEKLELGVKPRTTYEVDQDFFKPFE
jgi:restriction system protein